MGSAGQFLVGVLLGVVWSPCVGPTLGAASTLASQGKDLGQIGLLMLLFGLGAALPLILIGSLSRATLHESARSAAAAPAASANTSLGADHAGVWAS